MKSTNMYSYKLGKFSRGKKGDDENIFITSKKSHVRKIKGNEN